MKTSDKDVNPDGVRGVSEDKRWGDQMFYAYGRLFSWSAGKQMGEGGAFGTFNYGNGYAENLITEQGGTVVGDSSDVSDEIKAYRNHRHNWDFSSGWSPGVWDRWLPFIGVVLYEEPEIMKVKELDPSKTIAEKTFGHTYSYHMGYAVNIHEGHSASRTYGDTDDVVYGDSNSVVAGDSESVTFGDSESVTYGTTREIFHGNKRELLLGADTELKLAVDTEIKLAMDSTFHLGFVIGYQAAGFFNLTTGIGIDKTGCLIADSFADLKNKKTELYKKTIALNKEAGCLTKSEFRLAQAQAFFFG